MPHFFSRSVQSRFASENNMWRLWKWRICCWQILVRWNWKDIYLYLALKSLVWNKWQNHSVRRVGRWPGVCVSDQAFVVCDSLGHLSFRRQPYFSFLSIWHLDMVSFKGGFLISENETLAIFKEFQNLEESVLVFISQFSLLHINSFASSVHPGQYKS